MKPSADPEMRRAGHGPALRGCFERGLTWGPGRTTHATVRVLALETSTEVGSVALLENGGLLAELSVRVKARHGETLLPRVQDLLREQGVGIADVDLMAVGTGPGSFTGVRIAMATAQGLCLALDKPLVGVGSLRVLAAAVAPCDPGARVVTVVDAAKGEVFAAVYGYQADDHGGVTAQHVAPFHAPPDEVAARLGVLGEATALRVLGSGLRRYGDIFDSCFRTTWGARYQPLDPLFDTPRGGCLAREALGDLRRHGAPPLGELRARYVRSSDAQLPDVPLRLSEP